MVGGQWTNLDGLPLNFGTTKALPELAGDYLAYGETRILEAYITYGNTVWGSVGSPVIPVMASGTFNGTGTPQTAGIISLTYDFPLQTAKVGTGGTGGFTATTNLFSVNNTQIWVDEMSFEVLSTFVDATANSFNVGLVMWNASSSIWQIVLPAGSGTTVPNHFLNITTLGTLIAGQRWTWNSDAAGIPWGSTSANAPTIKAGAWLGNLPQITNTGATSNAVGYLAAIATGAPTSNSTSTAGGLAKFRLKYNIYGNIVQ